MTAGLFILIMMLSLVFSLPTMKIRHTMAKNKVTQALGVDQPLTISQAMSQTAFCWQVNVSRLGSLIAVITCVQLLI